MLVTKTLPLLVTIVLTLALHTKSPSFLKIIGHRLWHVNQSPGHRKSTLASMLMARFSSDIERYRHDSVDPHVLRSFAMCDPDDLSPRRTGRLLKRTQSTSSEFYSVSECACSHRAGLYDLGAGSYPRFVFGRECYTANITVTNIKFSFLETCPEVPTSSDCCRDVVCKQETSPVTVLRRRAAGDKPSEKLPPELRNEWVFIELLVNSSCVLVPN